MRKIFGPRKDEKRGDWRGLHNEKLHEVYPSPNIMRVTKSRGKRWAGHVERIGEKRGVCRVLLRKPH
jgi:hypothetical protein